MTLAILFLNWRSSLLMFPALIEKHAHFLKSIEDAVNIRSRLMDAFESANYPGVTEEEKRRLLRFVVVGGGPTGVEYAAELHGTAQCTRGSSLS